MITRRRRREALYVWALDAGLTAADHRYQQQRADLARWLTGRADAALLDARRVGVETARGRAHLALAHALRDAARDLNLTGDQP